MSLFCFGIEFYKIGKKLPANKRKIQCNAVDPLKT